MQKFSNVFQQWNTINWKCSNISKKQTNALTRYSADWTRVIYLSFLRM